MKTTLTKDAIQMMNAMAAAMGQKHDAPGSPSGVIFSHGPQGNLAYPGVDPEVINAKVGALSLLSQLPTRPAVDTNPHYALLTGTTADTGSEMTDPCDNAPTAGLVKFCMHSSVFGRYTRATPELDVTRLGQVVDRADPMDLNLSGDPTFGPAGPFNTGRMSTMTPRDILRSETARKMWELALSMHALLSRQVWTGNPSNNSAGGGYQEWTGIQSLVTTGYLDAQTGQLCPAADSQVEDFQNHRVDATGTQIVAALHNMFYQRKDVADRAGLSPVRWVWAMRPQLFYELTQIWPCAYNTYRCLTLNTQTSLNIDAQRMTDMRDDMRRGKSCGWTASRCR